MRPSTWSISRPATFCRPSPEFFCSTGLFRDDEQEGMAFTAAMEGMKLMMPMGDYRLVVWNLPSSRQQAAA